MDLATPALSSKTTNPYRGKRPERLLVPALIISQSRLLQVLPAEAVLLEQLQALHEPFRPPVKRQLHIAPTAVELGAPGLCSGPRIHRLRHALAGLAIGGIHFNPYRADSGAGAGDHLLAVADDRSEEHTSEL